MSSLIEGLPDDVALRCLAFVPFYLHAKLELVSRSWKAVIRSGEICRVRREVGSLEDLLFVCCYDVCNTWQFYDPLRDLWITLPRLPSTRKQAFGVVSTSQKLFVLGGLFFNATGPSMDDDFSCNEVWSFDPVTRNWSMRAPMLESRAMFACGVLDGKIIVAGGFNRKYETISKVEMYDPVKDLWIPLPDLPRTYDSGCIAVVIGRKMLLVYKGESVVQTFDSLECKWRVEDYGWFYNLSSMAAAQDSLYIISHEFILKQDGPDNEVVVLAHQFRRKVGMGMICSRGKLYVIGGVLFHERDSENLSDVHVLTLDDKKPTWFNVASMSRGRGTVLGCAELRL